ncbi:MAG: SIR2 family protein, partial [Chlorobiaceae bacterium]
MAFPASMIPLSKLLEKDQPKVLVVVGAGVSMGATGKAHASWLGLLEHGIGHLVDTGIFTPSHRDTLLNSLKSAFSPFDLALALQHAENVEVNLKTLDLQAFADWLESAFRDLTPRPGGTDTLDALRDLQQAGALLLTTNYDSLLSDATGLPPVSWDDHEKLLQVISQQQNGILHIHGHWQQPSSVVLGRSSYDRVVKDEKFQSAFKSLWLEWSWVYVGCGDGVDDPNLGRLLEWGKQWGKEALPDYFLAKEDKASALAARPEKPSNLVCIGYPDYRKLPELLRGITPTVRCSPFVLVDCDFDFFRSPSPGSASRIPFPSQQEYLDGNVPALHVDAEVCLRLDKFGWAFVLDVASVGKTTLAIRISTQLPFRDYPTFYLDLANIDIADGGVEAAMTLHRLSRPNTLLIIDNVHHQPELARQLWSQWRDRQRNSKLLLIGTRVQRSVITAPAQDLAFFEHHSSNPAVELRPEPEDLKHIAQSIHKRFMSGSLTTPLEPPLVFLREWYQRYGNALGAFCVVVLARLANLQRGEWSLPPEAAVDWVREKWINPLNKRSIENLLCLSVFAAQELEIAAPKKALPHPDETDQLLKSGLVARDDSGVFGQYQSFRLREPDWGQLILVAQRALINSEEILIETAARDPNCATLISIRLRNELRFELHKKLWAHLATVHEQFTALVSELSLLFFPVFIREAEGGKQHLLVDLSWEAIEREPDKLAARAWEKPLGVLGSFLEIAKRHGRKTEPLWDAIEREPEKLATRAWETSLHQVGSFLEIAKRHGRKTEPL